MEKTFSKDDLKSGYVVVLRDCSRYMVHRVGKAFTKVLAGGKDGRYIYMSSYSNELKMVNCHSSAGVYNDERSDIIEVYGLITRTANYDAVLTTSLAGRELLWKRKQAVKLTVDQISEMLGYEVEIVGDRHHAE
jgi:hypothetical protein